MNVGDYVRTDIGEIRKVVRVTDDLYILDKDVVFAHKDKIKKISPNIIDLIEVGDIVNYEQLNGGVVLNKKDDSIDTWSIFPNSLKNEDIKSVITKEQLKNCMYEVGE